MGFLLHIFFALLLPFQPMKPGVEAGSGFHPFFVSVTEIDQNAASKSLEISCKFFADDLEQTLEKAYNTRLDISSTNDKTAFDKVIPDYVNKHLQLTINGKPAKLTYVGYEKDKESAYCYFEVDNVASVQNIAAANTLLYDFKNEQINIMHVTVNGKRQSTKLDYPANKASFRF